MIYSKCMDLFDSFSESWKKTQKDLSKKDLSFISFKDSFRHGMRGFLTPEYYKREKLIKEGELAFGYVFKCWSDESSFSVDYPTWVLFSPSLKVSKNPVLLAKISENLLVFAKENKDKKHRKLTSLINEPLSECAYYELPKELTQGELIYLSITYVHLNQFIDFQMGINPIIISKGISKEILYLPDKYWTQEFAESYKNHALI